MIGTVLFFFILIFNCYVISTVLLFFISIFNCYVIGTVLLFFTEYVVYEDATQLINCGHLKPGYRPRDDWDKACL